jgi:hypothetical protein
LELAGLVGLRAELAEGGEAERPQDVVEVWSASRHALVLPAAPDHAWQPGHQ